MSIENKKLYAKVESDIYKTFAKRWNFDDSDGLEITLSCYHFLTFWNVPNELLTQVFYLWILDFKM